MFELLGNPEDETRLLVHRETGYSAPIPGHPLPIGTWPGFDMVVGMTVTPIEFGFSLERRDRITRADEFRAEIMPADARPAGLMASSLFESPTDLSTITGEAWSRPGEHGFAIVRVDGPKTWCLRVVVRLAPTLHLHDWHMLRSAWLSRQQWPPNPDRARNEAPALWAPSHYFEQGFPLRLSPWALAEAERVAAALAIEDANVLERLHTLVDPREHGNQPLSNDLRMWVEWIQNYVDGHEGAAAFADAFARVENELDYRGWCYLCTQTLEHRLQSE